MSSVRATATVKVGDVAGLLAKVGMGLYNGVSDGAALVETDARAFCPVRTGDLRDSIDTVVTRGIQEAERGGALSSSLWSVSAVIQPHMPYQAYVEYGTGRRGAESAGAGPFSYKESWPGQVAQPYMRPAADNNRENVVDAIKSGVQDALA